MITRMPSASALPLTYDVCPLGVEVPSLSLEILRRGFLALDHHGQRDVGRAIKQQLRERLVAGLDGELALAALQSGAEASDSFAQQPMRRRGHQYR